MFPHATALRRYAKATLGLTIDRRVRALCATSGFRYDLDTSYVVGRLSSRGFDRDRHHVWIILLHERDICAEVIAHESSHAAIHYLRMINRLPTWAVPHEPTWHIEERLTTPIGYIAEGITRAVARQRAAAP